MPFLWNQPCIFPTTIFVEAALFLMIPYEDLWSKPKFLKSLAAQSWSSLELKLCLCVRVRCLVRFFPAAPRIRGFACVGSQLVGHVEAEVGAGTPPGGSEGKCTLSSIGNVLTSARICSFGKVTCTRAHPPSSWFQIMFDVYMSICLVGWCSIRHKHKA